MSSRSINEKLVALTKKMQAAAEAMDFELATRLRNEIARLKGEAPVQPGDPDTVTVSQPPPGAMGTGDAGAGAAAAQGLGEAQEAGFDDECEAEGAALARDSMFLASWFAYPPMSMRPTMVLNTGMAKSADKAGM